MANKKVDKQTSKLKEKNKENSISRDKKKVKIKSEKITKNKKVKEALVLDALEVIEHDNLKIEEEIVEELEPFMTARTKKIIKYFALICLFFLVIEGLYILYMKTIYAFNVSYDVLNNLVLDDTNIVAVGSSDSKYSKYNKYTKNIEKAKIVKYDNKGKILFEKVYPKNTKSTYTAISVSNDSYITAGYYQNTNYKTAKNKNIGLLVKYDLNGNLIWDQSYSVLEDTIFTKVISVLDGYVVIGRSLAKNSETNETGGGIIVKYDLAGQVVWSKNYGDSSLASFNGIVETETGYYVVGKDSSDLGLLIKYDKLGNYVFHQNYHYTDEYGFSDIKILGDALYVIGSKKNLNAEVDTDEIRTTTDTNGLLVKYNLNGEIIFEKNFGGSSYERFNSLAVYGNHLFVIGLSNSDDAGLKIFTDGQKTSGILLKYDINGTIVKKGTYGGTNIDNITSVITDNSNLYLSGYSNSKDGNIITNKNNGKDYFSKLIKLDSKFRIIFTK